MCSWEQYIQPPLPPFYWIIILGEFTAASCCAIGAVRLAASLRSQQRFEAAKTLPLAGLWLGLLLWSFAFITVGGEWFSMWEWPRNSARPGFHIAKSGQTSSSFARDQSLQAGSSRAAVA